jgi:hypothetical protein
LAREYELHYLEWIGMSVYSETKQSEKEERIRAAAHLIWEREGRPDGHALAHWVRATEVVEAEEGSESDAVEESSAKPEQTRKRAKGENSV